MGMKKYILLVMIFPTVMWAIKCYDSHCSDLRLGIGGYYANFTGPTSSSQGKGGYLTFSSKSYNDRLYLGGDTSIGFGQYVLNTSLNNLQKTKEDFGYFLSTALHVGTNLGSRSTPLLIYPILSAEWHKDTIKEYSQGFFNMNFSIGIGTYTRLMLGEKFGLDFQAGASYIFAKRYIGYGFNQSSWFDKDYRLEVAIGLIYRQNDIASDTKNPDFYIRAKGVYYGVNTMDIAYFGDTTYFNGQTLHFPKSQNFMILLEMGLGLHSKWW